jgi:ankyrin repeat protein
VRQADTARLLLANGADPHHISSINTTLPYYLYEKQWACGAHIEFFEILAAQSFEGSDLDVQSSYGFSAFHFAARHGVASDVLLLEKHGASRDSRQPALGWTPAFVAAYCNNVDTLRTLVLPRQPPPMAEGGEKDSWEAGGAEKGLTTATTPSNAVSEVDARGWTLLHVAASMGNVAAMEFLLLEAGADPKARTPPGYEHMADELKGRSLSTVDLARHAGEKTLEAFLDIMSRKEETSCTLSEDGELFWDT